MKRKFLKSLLRKFMKHIDKTGKGRYNTDKFSAKLNG